MATSESTEGTETMSPADGNGSAPTSESTEGTEAMTTSESGIDKEAANQAYGALGASPTDGLGASPTDGGLETGQLSPYDVLIMLCVNQLDSKEKVDVVETLTNLGMEDIIEAARISLEAEEEEKDEEGPTDDPEPEPADGELADDELE